MFINITNTPNSFTWESQHMSHLKRFTVLMYSKNCGADLVNNVSKLMFTQGIKSLESIPISQHALLQHIKLLTIAFIWKMPLSKSLDISKKNYRTKGCVSYWTDLPNASHELLHNCVRLVLYTGRCNC